MTDEELVERVMQDFYCGDEMIAAANCIKAQAAEIERLRSYLDRIEKASEFFTNPEHSELTLRYAHEGTQRLAREALTGAKP